MVKNQFLSGWRACACTAIMSLVTSCLSAWTAPIDLSTAGANDQPLSAVDPAGNAIVVWINGSSPSVTIQGATYISGIWSSPFTIAGPDAYESPFLSVDESGNAVIVVEHFVNGAHEIQAIHIPFGGAPSLPVSLSFVGDNQNPSVALNGNGTGFAVWEDRTTDQVYAARLVDYTSWIAPTVVAQSGGLFVPSITLNDNNEAITYWYCSGSCTAQTSVYSNGSWSNNVALDDTYCPQWNNIVISLDPNGNAVALWIEDELSQVVSANKPANGSWTTGAIISDAIFNSFQCLEADSAGNAVAAWVNFDQNVVEAASFVSGSWQSPVIVSNTIGNQETTLTVSGAGDAIITYQSWEGGVINAVELPFGGSWSYPLQISENSGYSFSPFVKGNDSGQALAVWVNSDGSNNIVQASLNY